MSNENDGYIKIYKRYLLVDYDIEFSHEDLTKIVIGCFISNNQQVDDLNNENLYIDIIEYICMKLIVIPKYTHYIRSLMTNFASMKELLTSKRITICETIMILFTPEQIKECIF